jgi:hypothetical protein
MFWGFVVEAKGLTPDSGGRSYRVGQATFQRLYRFAFTDEDFRRFTVGGFAARLLEDVIASGALAQLGPSGAQTSSGSTEAAYVAAMKSDLRNLVTAEEAYFSGAVKYTDRFEALPRDIVLPGGGRLRFSLTSGNRLMKLELTRNGWWAQLGNPNTVTTCSIFIGSTPAPPATREGEPECR